MPTDCSAELFDFGTVEGRAVEAAFDAGLVTSDAGGLLLGATDQAIGMIDRFAAACNPAHNRQSGQRGISAQCPSHGRLSAVSLG